MRQTLLVLIALLAIAGWLVVGVLGGEDAPAPSPELAPEDQVATEAERTLAISRAAIEQVGEDADALSALAFSLQQQIVALIERVDVLTDSTLAERLDVILIASLQAARQIETAGGDARATAALDALADAEEELAGLVRADAGGMRSPVPVRVPPAAGYGLAALALLLGCVAFVAGVRSGQPGSSRTAATVRASVAMSSAAPATGAAGITPAAGVARRAPVSGGVQVPHLLSREAMEEVVRTEQSRANRYGHTLSMLLITVNEADQIREDNGEEDLRYTVEAVAELAITNTRASDIVGMLDDERIIVLAAETDTDHARAIARKLEQSVQLFPFDGGIHATISTTITDATGDLRLESLG